MAQSHTETSQPRGDQGLSAPSISLPKGGGAIHGMGEKFAANPAMGTGSMSVPLVASPGRAGFSPQLSLSYDSSAGNGPFGFGWSLSIPVITRKTETGLPEYRDAEESDVYIVSGAEDLVPVLLPDGTRFQDDASAPGYVIHRYRPRVEGLFARIERWTNTTTGDVHWRSISRDNVTTLYGRDDNSRIFDPSKPASSPDTAAPAHVFSWLGCETYDDKGNAIVYEYAAENDENVDLNHANERNRVRAANRYLKRVKYGNRISRLIQPDVTETSWMFEVVFDYDEGHYEKVDLDPALPEDQQHRFVRASASEARPWKTRPDPFSSYRAGFEVRTYRRCHRVHMFHHVPDHETADKGYDGLVRSIEFDYGDLDYSAPPGIDAELAHQGSTRFASFIRTVTRSGYVLDDTQAPFVSNGVHYSTYVKKSLPPLEFEYSKATIRDEVLELDATSLENLPVGLDVSTYQWLDLDGEGVSGILTEQGGAWLYKPNLGEGRFGSLEAIDQKPSLAALRGGQQQLLDLAGDGCLDLVFLADDVQGFYKRSDHQDWERFQEFREMPNIGWDDPNLRFIDLAGDGRADVLITEQEVLTWYPSLAEEGFARSRDVRHPLDDEHGPRLIFADGTQSIHLGDMSGDGLTDLVCIRNGEVCYWPNLGYGRFGSKVTMDNAPWFDDADQFDQRRVRLADIDGSGTSDIVYTGRDGVRFYFNQSGNQFSELRRLTGFPRVDDTSSVMAADLLGNGTACLVWSSRLGADARSPLRYIDLMGGTKPHLLVKSVNNLGAETEIKYAPSTRFYLADKANGHPWLSRLPYPVHVVERVVTHDRISGNRFVTRYAYHHGYFDGVEREFRGFGMVEQRDTEELAALTAEGELSEGTNIDAASHIPPVLTKTWFHTGIYLDREHVSAFFAGTTDATDVGEYYREPGLDAQQAAALLLNDTVLPHGLTADEEREACRALKNSMLHQEVYALDGTARQQHPYAVTEQNFTIRVLQRRNGNRHAVFFVHERESVSYHYEREAADPRTGHILTLEVDEFGNALKAAAIGYGRRQPDPALSEADQLTQGQVRCTYSENSFTNTIDTADGYRIPPASESLTYELTGLAPTANRLTFDEVLAAATTATPISYENEPTSGVTQKRLVEHVRTYYRANNLEGSLLLGQLESLALPFERYKLAFTPGLVAKVYGDRASDELFASDGRYVHTEGDSNWWRPSGQSFYSPDPADSSSEELSYARQHYFLPHRYRDPFHTDAASTESFVTYDSYDLLVQETRDALGNRITVGERNADPSLPPIRLRQDYRVLQPAQIMDPNSNRSEVSFDALGMVVGSAIMGKPEDTPVPGDRITQDFRADLTQAEIDEFLADPTGPLVKTLLGDATTRVVYDLSAYSRETDPAKTSPVVTATLARETHASDPLPDNSLRIQVSFSYSDGLGREIQSKIQAEPGPVPKRDAAGKIILDTDGQPAVTPTNVDPRWVGSGWTVFNNKGSPARRYEPFFTDTHRFEFDIRIGASYVLFYDPFQRQVATLRPDHTFEKVIYDTWRREAWDTNDTVLIDDPKTDPDVGSFFSRLPDADYLPTWHEIRTTGQLGPVAQSAATKAELHAATPAVAHFDSLGRTLTTIADNGAGAKYATRVELDIEDNERTLIDAHDRKVITLDYDMLANTIHQASMDAGDRWMLKDASGKTIRTWDSRGHAIRTSYDRVRRPTHTFVQHENDPEKLVERILYGEEDTHTANGHSHSAIGINSRGRIYQHYDGAGVATNDQYDFKGNLTRSTRRLAVEYKQQVDWSPLVGATDAHEIASLAEPMLEIESFESSRTYDALDRPTSLTTPDHSETRSTYNKANLLERIDVRLRGETNTRSVVTECSYNAKGQCTLIAYANGTRTQYSYDPQTFRLTNLFSSRGSTFPGDCPSPPDAPCGVQNLRYTYDPTGNIAHIRDDAQQTIFFNGQVVEPSTEYTYDAIYRLIEARGREHIGQVDSPQTTPGDEARVNLPHPQDGQAMRQYTEMYEYDEVGNFLTLTHHAKQGDWVRVHIHDDPSLLEPSKSNNRLARTVVHPDSASPILEPYAHDAHGNLISMPHLPLMLWDYRDQLHATSRQVLTSAGSPETTYYVYDAAGRRIRKVTERQANEGESTPRAADHIYSESYELRRTYNGNGQTIELERETLHVFDGARRIAMYETRTLDASAPPTSLPATATRYQYGNRLGSATLELDETGSVISYEEYHPFGSTAYQAVRSGTEVSAKRYRYSDKERDEESGFYYHGARYYACWLGRWTSADPSGLADGPNLFTYCHNNPIGFTDPDGRAVPNGTFTRGSDDLARLIYKAFGRDDLVKSVDANQTAPPVVANASGAAPAVEVPSDVPIVVQPPSPGGAANYQGTPGSFNMSMGMAGAAVGLAVGFVVIQAGIHMALTKPKPAKAQAGIAASASGWTKPSDPPPSNTAPSPAPTPAVASADDKAKPAETEKPTGTTTTQTKIKASAKELESAQQEEIATVRKIVSNKKLPTLRKMYNEEKARVDPQELAKFRKEDVVYDVNIGVPRGSYEADFEAADRLAKITPEWREAHGLTWHHHQTLGRMQLVRKSIHNKIAGKNQEHTGGIAVWQNMQGLKSGDYPLEKPKPTLK
jgi:RHS repeat-associated protein